MEVLEKGADPKDVNTAIARLAALTEQFNALASEISDIGANIPKHAQPCHMGMHNSITRLEESHMWISYARAFAQQNKDQIQQMEAEGAQGET